MARSERRSNGPGTGFLTRLIFLVILIPVAIAAVAYLLSPSSPFKAATPDIPKPVVIGPIHKQDKLITASTDATKIMTASTQNIIPFSKESYQYMAVFTLTAGIDMSKIKDSDVQVTGDGKAGYTITIRLPEPQIFSTELDTSRSSVISHDEQLLSSFSKNPNLLSLVQDQAKKDVVTQVLQQGQLLSDAKTNAEEDIRNLILQANAGTETHIVAVNFVYGVAPTPDKNATPKVTVAPA